MERLRYERINNSDSAIMVDLKNGYSVMAVYGRQPEERCYIATLFLAKNGYEYWQLVDEADQLKLYKDYKEVNAAILKQIGTYNDSGFFEPYIKRYEFMEACVNSFYDLLDKAQDD